MNAISIISDIAVILTLLAATALMIALLVAFLKWFPACRRTTDNLERVSLHLVSTSQNIEQRTAHLAKITGDFAEHSDEISSNVAEAARNIVDSSGYVRTAVRLLELLAPAGQAVQLTETGLGRVIEWVRGQGSGSSAGFYTGGSRRIRYRRSAEAVTTLLA